MPEGQISLKGAIEPGVIAEVLQFICGRRDHAGYLRVSNQHATGRIWCQEGAIVAAECGAHRDLPAIRRILCMKSGEFAFVDTAALPERTLFDETTTILLDSYRQMDETQEREPEAPEPAPAATSLQRPSAPWAQQNTAPQPTAASATAASHTTITTSAVSHAPRPALSNYPTKRPRQPAHRKVPRWAAWTLLVATLASLLGAGSWLLWHHRTADTRASLPPIAATGQPGPATETTGSRWSAFWHALFAARPAPPPPPPAQIVWPALRLSGIVDAPGQTASAIINGRLVIAGETVEGVRLDAVTRTGIVLRSGSHTLFVSETTIGDPQEPATHTTALAASTNTFARLFPAARRWLKQRFNP